MMRCFIFSAGSFFGLREMPAADDLIIAADAGYLLCKRLNIRPNLLMGDFDSMEQPREAVHFVRVPVEKDDTDTMLAVKEGLERGCREFYFYGATGGARLDHTLANMQTLAYLCRHGARGYLYDKDFAYTVIENETLTLQRQVDWGLVSLFALGDKAEGVALTGLQYPLNDATLTCDFPLAVSNHFAADTATVAVGSGPLLVGWELPPLA